MADDPYRYFRIEAREILEGLSKGVLDLEKGADRDVVARLLRLAHTLKGAARVVRQPEVAELAHALEDALAPHRAGAASVPRERVDEMLSLLDGIAGRLAALGQPEAPRGRAGDEPAALPAPEPAETVRVEIGEMDALLEGVAEAGAQLSALRREAATLERARHLAGALVERLDARPGAEGEGAALVATRSLAEELHGALRHLQRVVPAGLDRTEGELAQVRDHAQRLRLLPAGAVFAPLERAARDAARTLRKAVAFGVVGGDVRLDAHVLSALRDAMLHAVRNAVAHGIEPEAERLAAGKARVGRVEVVVERRGQRVAVTCRDDGRGFDVEEIRRAAVRSQRVSAAEAASLSFDDAARLVLEGGVTTAGAVDEVSGRGVGLDVVRATAARLKGAVRVRSERGRGTAIEVLVPVSLSALEALAVEVAGSRVYLPLDAVRRTVAVGAAERARAAGREGLVHEGVVVPYLPLAVVLQRWTPARDGRRAWPAVVVQSGEALAALGVDRLLGIVNVVMRPLPGAVPPDPVVAGAVLDVEGAPVLVLDPAGLVAAAHGARAAEPAPDARLPVLVVDDSLTTRMLEQSILESAGYEVDVASSAEEALERARARRYGVFVVDVEMPGMDGYEFVARTRADEALRATPAILVTSRGAPEDRRRGEEAGARAYIVKSEFDQEFLLARVRELMG